MSAAKWIGFLVKVDCGDIGVFEGRVCSIDDEKGCLSLRNVSLDKKFLSCGNATIKIYEIKDLKILSTEPEPVESEQNDLTKQLEFDGRKELGMSPQKQMAEKKFTTPDQKRSSGYEVKKSLKKRTEECFSTPLESVQVPDFDFEKNLKLFDKEAVFEKLKGSGATVSSKKKTSSGKKLKHNEHVLESEPVSMRQIVAPLEHTGREYHTDEGVVVPSISLELRNKLIRVSESMGFTAAQRVENAGLCTCQMALQLVGGSNRFTSRNSHQPPHIVVMAGPNTVGVNGVCAARHLANHKVQVTLFVPIKTEILVPHLALYFHTGCRLVSSTEDIPTQPVDLVIHALIGHEEESANPVTTLEPVLKWANNNKAPVLILDPCSRVGMFGVEAKWSLTFALPLIKMPSDCRMYLADVGIPKGVFNAVDIKYTSPFGDKFVIALNN